ncbi:MAG: hypothetical protein F6K41_10240 [Symploca sp. SIO3E6]|nr:hypothetical protein [Caldora sp. SIO3E6]
MLLLTEPMETVVAALFVILNKFGDKIVGKSVDKLFEQGIPLLKSLRGKSPETVIAIEQAKEVPLNFGQAVLEVEAAAKTEPDIAEAVQQIEATVREDSQLAAAIQKLIEEMKSQATVQNSGKLAEKINALFQGTTISGGNVGNTLDFQNSTNTGVFQNTTIHGGVKI